MGNSKSSVQLSNSFDKDNQFNCETDDGGFLEAKLKSTEASLSRGQTGRKSFHYIRLRENQDLAQANANSLSDKLKRVHSLPPARIKKKGTSTLPKKDAASGKQNNKIPVQGFDMFRHHLGQMNCDVTLFQALESEIHTLNAKLVDIEQTRQSCLDKLNELHKDVRQNQNSDPKATATKKGGKADDLALVIIHNYIQRIEGLLKVEEEPFLLDVPGGKTSASSSDKSLSSQLAQFQEHKGFETPRGKRQKIKDSYNQLIRSVMPKLFGKHFAHKNEANYSALKQNLTDLRDQVSSIATSDEQKLVDAKRIFLQEIDGYLRTLDEMITCTEKDCARCKD